MNEVMKQKKTINGGSMLNCIFFLLVGVINFCVDFYFSVQLAKNT